MHARLAQVSNGFSYYFSTDQKAYQSLTGADDLTNGFVWDHARLAIPLGFELAFFEGKTDTLYLDTFLGDQVVGLRRDMDAEGPLMVFYTGQITDRAMENSALMGSQGSESPILLKTIGLPGNRITIVEFRNMGFRSDIAIDQLSTDYVNFQILILEKTGDIEFIMGPSRISDVEGYFDGKRGPSLGLIPEFDFSNEDIINYALWFEGFPCIPSVAVADSMLSFSDTLTEGQTFQFNREGIATDLENISSAALELYPNPARSHVHLNFESPGPVKVELLDAQGRILINRIMQSHGLLNLAGLPTGTYLVKAHAEGQTPIYKKIMHL